MFRVFFVVLLSFTATLQAQTVTYWSGGFAEHWTDPTSGAAPTSHNNPQPVSLCPDGSSDATGFCPCSRLIGSGLSVIHLNNVLFFGFGAHTETPANHGSDQTGFHTEPNIVGDHVDGFLRYDDVGNANYDGTYNRVCVDDAQHSIGEFFALPPNGQLHTLCDDSVAQDVGDALPTPYQPTGSEPAPYHPTVTQGTNWQDGSGFTAFDGPPLTTDAAGSHRVFAFFTVESFPGDSILDQNGVRNGVGSHLIGFASVSLPAGATSMPQLWTARWKDASSPNDGDYKQSNGVPLRTLYLREFAPVIAFRGDTGIRVETTSVMSVK